VVVDDDSSVLRTVHRQLDRLGWEAHAAESATAALAMLDRLGRVEAVLTDVDMPAMNGVSLRSEVVRRFPGTAVVLMSGGCEPAPLPDVPPSTVLRKPFTMEGLAAALAAVRGDRT
jgi:DNA-binding NtrC family response regulator